ncbi:MAG: flagellar hook capping protein [Melioribacteraceae bacterium]|nr:flagellar hook capping protein [Melioribacteraceae bacterium]MCF8353728.1 flagellar hook capping protein [Melioribacteraceae bacterium]MCF8392463.1 flagellar hook capping protein [Melioribacteraceae bacterium]MCF8418374.1 flagellar hook capping protein [Melioribacteraceae bacterium]
MNIDGLNSQLGQFNSMGTGNNVLGKDDFMTLLIEQLKNQDPLNPMEGSEFAAQLAQFSSLEQLSNMNETLQSSINANYQLTQSINNTMSAGLIGKQIKIETNNISYEGQESIDIGYSLAGNAANGSIKIYNDQGLLIKTIDSLDFSKGDHKVSWDFTDNNGDKVGNGNYTFEFTAMTSSDQAIDTKAYLTGIIDSIRFTENGTMLVLDNIEYQLSDVIEIINPETEDGDNNG